MISHPHHYSSPCMYGDNVDSKQINHLSDPHSNKSSVKWLRKLGTVSGMSLTLSRFHTLFLLYISLWTLEVQWVGNAITVSVWISLKCVNLLMDCDKPAHDLHTSLHPTCFSKDRWWTFSCYESRDCVFVRSSWGLGESYVAGKTTKGGTYLNMTATLWVWFKIYSKKNPLITVCFKNPHVLAVFNHQKITLNINHLTNSPKSNHIVFFSFILFYCKHSCKYLKQTILRAVTIPRV